MKLRTIDIRGYRSIECVSIADCGGFNVLIGKNNAGKSNILAALRGFFECISGGAVVTPTLTFGGDSIDFSKTTSSTAGLEAKPSFLHPTIDISLTFILTLAERDELLRDIVIAAPQMKNAVDGLSPSLLVQATLRVMPAPQRFAFLSDITIWPEADRDDPHAARVLLKIGPDAAVELRDRAALVARRRQDLVALSGFMANFDADDLRRMRAELEGGSPRPGLRYFNRFAAGGVSIPAELVTGLEQLIRDSRALADFESGVQSMTSRASEEIAGAERDPLKATIVTFTGDESKIPSYVQSLVQRVSDVKVLYLHERRKPIGREEAERLLSLKVKRGGDKKLRIIHDTVESLLGVQIDAFRSEQLSPRGEQVAELDVDNFLVQANGSGIREALRLILDFEFEEPQILLVEEPEVHLHPALETSMMRYLKGIGRECQVFITTHSTNFLDSPDMKNLYLVARATHTTVQHLSFEDAERALPKELGIRLSSFFMYDRLVFVEGKSDEEVLREWAAMLGVNVGQKSIGFIPMGGARNIGHFAAEATLAFLSRRNVALHFIIDRDERDDADIARLEHLMTGHATINVLKRRELENYMIVPRAILELLRQKASAGGTSLPAGLTEGTVGERIQVEADALREMAVSKRVAKVLCRPLYPRAESLLVGPAAEIAARFEEECERIRAQLDQDKARVDDLATQFGQEVDANWATRRLNVVPGDELLQRTFRHFGLAFSKAKDSPRLARLIQPTELADEIREIFNNIAQ